MDEVKKTREIKKEIKRLKTIYDKLEAPKKVLAEKLIENAAFLSVTLAELRLQLLNIDNLVETYQHGGGQSGTKQSSYVTAYDSVLKSYSSIIGQLDKMLPRPKPVADKKASDTNDQLNAFINAR